MANQKKEDVKNKTEKLLLEARNFFDAHKKELGTSIREGKNVVYINFNDLASFAYELAERLISLPEETIDILEAALEDSGIVENPRVRMELLPTSHFEKIRNLRSRHLNKLIQVEGIVRQASEVRPQVINAKFECPSCGAILSVLQVESQFKEPKRCSCGRKGSFKLTKKDMVDAQRLVVEESPESLVGGEQPRRVNVFLKEDLVEPKMEEKTTPGSRIQMIGVLKEIPITSRSGSKLTRSDIAVEANNIIPMEETFEDLELSDEDERQIKELAADPNVLHKFTDSIAPSIYGYHEVKKALSLQLFGGMRKIKSDKTTTRGDIHIFLIGDPGVAKSQLLKYVGQIAPKGRYVAGKSTSGAGLCVSPRSTLMTNPGGMKTIQKVVDTNIKTKKEYVPGVWRDENVQNLKIQSMSDNLKIQSKKPDYIWKLQAPKNVFEITLRSGKKVELTGNTQLFSIKDGECKWKKSKDIGVGDYVATPRKLIGGNKNCIYASDLIKSNPVIHGIKKSVKKIAKDLSKKYKDLRTACRKLKIHENNLYHNWVKEKARGNIKLNNLKKICSEVGEDYKRFVREISLYNGKNHKIPEKLGKNFFYFAGLIAGDGDVRKVGGGTYSIRLSNSNDKLQKVFQETLEKEFELKYDFYKGCKKRPEATRTYSKILAEILFEFGICESPKKTNLEISNKILHCSNELIGEYIAGLYDADGSVYIREGKGSSCIEFSTCSEKLARQLQLVFLRYGIYTNLRKKSPSKGKINGNYHAWILEIRGLENFKKFKKNIPLKHSSKKINIEKLVQKEKQDTNLDVLPGVGKKLRDFLKNENISLKKAGWHNNLSRRGLQKIIKKNKIKDKELLNLAYNDIFWEEVKEIKKKEADYDFVYDLTVKDSHNFVVDGVLVHNTATVVKDEYLRGWSLEAGAMVLSNKGIICIDELDKMDDEDRSSMHEALEQQTVTISKANIQATLRAQTSVLAAANPKFGRFDPYDTVSKQIDLPPTLINRFDVIFIMKDNPDKANDEAIASHVLMEHKEAKNKSNIDTELLRKYVAYARQNVNPVLTKKAIEEIKKFYVDLRNTPVGSDEHTKPLPISARQLEALVRLSEASAKVRLSDKVEKKDADVAIDLMKYYLMQVGYDYETKTFDIDRIATGVSTSERGKIVNVKEKLAEMESKLGKLIPIEELKKELEGKMKEDEIDKALDKLTISGDIFHPKKGHVQRM